MREIETPSDMKRVHLDPDRIKLAVRTVSINISRQVDELRQKRLKGSGSLEIDPINKAA